MSTKPEDVEALVRKEYEHGFYTDVESDTVPPGLSEDVIRMISAKKEEKEYSIASSQAKDYSRRTCS